MTPTPVRKGPRGRWHLCRSTGRGYQAACGRTLAGGTLEVPRRILWAKVWVLELVCRDCDRIGGTARSTRELARLAGWR